MVTALQAFRFSAGRQQLRYFPALLEKKPFPSLLALSPLSTTLQHEQVNRRFATKAVTEPSKTVYVNDRNTHIRILSLYLTGQSTYWTVLVAENYFTPLEDASESLSMFTSVVTSPFWSVAGFACSLMMWAMGYSYTSHLVSRIETVGRRKVEISTFNLLGGVTEPKSYALEELKFLATAPQERDGYVSFKAADNQLNLLMDKKRGKFFPDGVAEIGYNDVTEEQQRRRMLEVSRRLGAAWSAIDTEAKPAKRAKEDISEKLKVSSKRTLRSKRRKRKR